MPKKNGLLSYFPLELGLMIAVMNFGILTVSYFIDGREQIIGAFALVFGLMTLLAVAMMPTKVKA